MPPAPSSGPGPFSSGEAVSSSFSSTPSKGGFRSWQKAAQCPAAWPGPAPGLLIHLGHAVQGLSPDQASPWDHLQGPQQGFRDPLGTLRHCLWLVSSPLKERDLWVSSQEQKEEKRWEASILMRRPRRALGRRGKKRGGQPH